MSAASVPSTTANERVIVNVARESQARMIVIPTRQQARPEMVFGRTVEHRFQKAPCDVMIYRPARAISSAV